MQKQKIQVEIYHVVGDSDVKAQLLTEAAVHAGFPSPVQPAYQSQPIDLNRELIDNPATTYIMKVVGVSMIDEGIDEGDMIVVDRSLFPTEHNLAVVMLDNEFAVKRIVQREGKVFLISGNKDYPPIEVKNPEELRVWGVVRWVMKKK